MPIFPILRLPLVGLLLMLLPWSASAVVKLEVSPPLYEFDVLEGGGTAQAAFDLQITGLTDGVAVAAYDLGLIYDPSIMKLASFGGFTTLLGNPDSFEVFNTSYDESPNSTWDYRDPDPDFGAYIGPVLGTPASNGNFIEGSLRFAQLSGLPRNELLALQNPAVNDTLVLFSLIFDVFTTEQNQRRGTPLRFVDDQDYANWTGDPNEGLLDVKLSTEDDQDALLSSYLERSDAFVSVVPVPASAWLMGVGLAVFGAVRARRRMHRA